MTTNAVEDQKLITYSFRAECGYELHAFFMGLEKRALETGAQLINNHATDGLGFEFQTSMSLETLRDILRPIQDAHIILQTLRPLSLRKNSLNRDYELGGCA